jgi:hypothetical protein
MNKQKIEKKSTTVHLLSIKIKKTIIKIDIEIHANEETKQADLEVIVYELTLQ